MDIKIEDYEKLGAFYLGREYNLKAGKLLDNLVMYDSKDLVTHGVVLGMTGSGKTGLCLSLIEEAAMDGIPAIIIDPKGDLPNLLLTFPELEGANFRPWINEEDAARKKQSPDDFAAAQAAMWQKGLADWGQSSERIRQLHEKVDMAVYTPGSNAGIPVSILNSFEAPPFEIVDDAELLGERIESTVSSLLALIGVNADPIQSREHILMSNVLSTCWRRGENLDLAKLINFIQNPPFSSVGVVDIESFYPEKKRSELAMTINNLLAAPGFAAWMSGVPLDVSKLLYTPDGKPRLAIFSIAHLNDAERMFFVSLLLNQTLGWMRAQSGTTSLRALLYMDEVAGYFPPSAMPPSKKPMMTLLKQGRAFGLGCLLATQNPVDLDYKAMSNIGTWWLGRLQTERDKMRVLEGLEGAAATQNGAFDRGEMEQRLAGLTNRVFLMNNTHEDGPVVFNVRWAMSYLRGPLTRTQIKMLMDPRRKELMTGAVAPGAGVSSASGGPAKKGGKGGAGVKPPLPKAIAEYFLEPTVGNVGDVPLVYVPGVVRAAEITFIDNAKGIDVKKRILCVDKLAEGQTAFDWAETARSDEGADKFSRQAPEGVDEWVAVPSFALQPASFTAAKGLFLDSCVAGEALELLHSPALDEWSKPGESEIQFRNRLTQKAREAKDAAMDELRTKFGKKAAPIEERLRKAEAAVAKEKEDSKSAKLQAAISFGAGVLGALMGRKSGLGGLASKSGSVIGAAGRAWKQSSDVGRAEDTVEAVTAQLNALEGEMTAEVAKLQSQFDIMKENLETLKIPPLKKNVVLTALGLAWLPHYRVNESTLEPAWE